MYSHGIKKTILPRLKGKVSNLTSTERTSAPLGDALKGAGMDPILKDIFISRGIRHIDELDRGVDKLPSPWLLSGMEEMVEALVSVLEQQQKVTIVGDFDADGATSCVVAIKGLRAFGLQHVDFIVPNRFEYGYGLTPEIVALTKTRQPDVIITVDNGISSIEGVLAAKALGIKVLITDHHAVGHELPEADAIVNPNLPDDTFPSRNLAGVGVIFYVLLALRSRLRERHWFERQQLPEPNLKHLLDYVALGTVADVVALDQVNRILVHQGLLMIRSGRSHVGLRELIQVSGRSMATLSAADLGFAVGPRLNAAGRMDDMTLGIQCLLTEDANLAKQIALQLDELNRDRRDVEGQMKLEAMQLLQAMKAFDEAHLPAGVCLYDAEWHQGVIGILASRIKDRLHRPVIAFAPAGKDEIKGSARSIPGLHIRDVLSDLAVAHPKMLSKFGGHAMAAGMSLKMHDLPAFTLAFGTLVGERLKSLDLEQKIYSDGDLDEQHFTLEFAERLVDAGTWGQGFPEPLFNGTFDVVQARVLTGQHLKLVLRKSGSDLVVDAIAFFIEQAEQWLGVRKLSAAYRLDVNEFRGQRSVQLNVQYLEKLQ